MVSLRLTESTRRTYKYKKGLTRTGGSDKLREGRLSANAVERCPWCGSTITHAKFLQVQAAIREDERKKLADFEKDIRTQLEKQIALQQQKFVKERQALDAERAKLTKQIETVKLQAEKQRKKELAEMRLVLQKDRETALLKKDAEFARERE